MDFEMEIGFLLYASLLYKTRKHQPWLHFTSVFEERKGLNPVNHRFSGLCQETGPDLDVRALLRRGVCPNPRIHHREFQGAWNYTVPHKRSSPVDNLLYLRYGFQPTNPRRK